MATPLPGPTIHRAVQGEPIAYSRKHLASCYSVTDAGFCRRHSSYRIQAPLALLLMVSASLSLHSHAAQPQTITDALAGLAIDTLSNDITPAAFEAAKRAVIDVIGVSLAGHNTPGMKPVVDQMREWGGKPEATLWVHGGKLPAPAAAFINSSLTHALDLDDVHLPSGTHITSVIVPAAFAVAEATGASGRDTLAAIVLGVEVATRLRVPGKATLRGGFLPSSVYGGFGAAAASCRLMGCTKEQTVHALGLFYAHASGNRQALMDHTLTKRLQPAIAAKAGVFSAYLAAKGITGPHRAIEGSAGLLALYGVEKGPIPTVADVLQKRDFFEVERISYKRFAACGASHQVIQGAIDLANEHDLKVEDIAEVELFGPNVNSPLVGVPWNPDHPIPHVAAQFCAPYGVAAAIRHRRFGPAEITNDQIRSDLAVSSLAARVRVKKSDQFEGKYPGGETIRIRKKDGTILVASRNRDDILRPDLLSEADLIRKFNENAAASTMCSPQQAAAIVAAVRRLNEYPDIRTFVAEYLVLPTTGQAP